MASLPKLVLRPYLAPPGLPAQILISRRQTIAEATDTVDRLHVLVEQFYKTMSSRVCALEVSANQNGNDADLGVVLSAISGIEMSWPSHLKIWPSVNIAIGVIVAVIVHLWMMNWPSPRLTH